MTRFAALALGLLAGIIMFPALLESGVPLRYWRTAVRWALAVASKR